MIFVLWVWSLCCGVMLWVWCLYNGCCGCGLCDVGVVFVLGVWFYAVGVGLVLWVWSWCYGCGVDAMGVYMAFVLLMWIVVLWVWFSCCGCGRCVVGVVFLCHTFDMFTAASLWLPGR